MYHPEEGYNEIHNLQAQGKVEKIYYDENGLTDYEVDALGGETWYEHNRFNERKMEASPEGRTVGFDLFFSDSSLKKAIIILHH